MNRVPFCLLDDNRLKAWLLEATLVATGVGVMPLKALAQSAALFPFALDPIPLREFEQSSRLDLFRQGLDQDIVALGVQRKEVNGESESFFK